MSDICEDCGNDPIEFDVLARQNDELRATAEALAARVEQMREVMHKLACLGNGDSYGNSVGNCIAKTALSSPDNLATTILRQRDVRVWREAASLAEAEEGDCGMGIGLADKLRAMADDLLRDAELSTLERG